MKKLVGPSGNFQSIVDFVQKNKIEAVVFNNLYAVCEIFIVN